MLRHVEQQFHTIIKFFIIKEHRVLNQAIVSLTCDKLLYIQIDIIKVSLIADVLIFCVVRIQD